MSIPEPAPKVARPSVDLWVRALIPAAVGLVIAAALIAEPGPARYDLQLVAPRSALPGTSLPVRAHVLTAQEQPPRVIEAPILIDLRELRGGPPLAEARVVVSDLLGVEGTLDLPPDLEGEFLLQGRARVRDEDAFVARRVRVAASASPLPRHGRLQTDLQRYAPGPVTGSAPPDALDARVVGGDCSGQGACRLLVWVGRPAAAIRLVDAAGAEVLPRPECDGRFVSPGVIECAVRATNNEASVVVAAFREGREVGRRSVQLPMGTAAPELERATALPRGRLRVELARRYDEGPLIVDLFHEGHWRRSKTVSAGSHELSLDAPGLWRVQARSDPFGTDDVATRLALVVREGEDAVEVLARHDRQREWLDPMAVAIRRGEPPCPGPREATGPCSSERWASFMLAAGELEIVALPAFTSGAAQMNAGLHGVGQLRRMWAAGLILLAGLFVAIVVVRRGLRATRQAEALLEAPVHRRPWAVWGSGAFVVLAFVAAALLVLSRGCL